MPPTVQQYQSQQYNTSAQTTPQPSTSEPTLKELLEQMTMQNLKFKQESMKIQQETQAAMQNLSDQIGQMTTLALEENAEYYAHQARISSNSDPGRPISSSTTLPILKEVEVSIPQSDYIDDYTVDGYVTDNHIVAEHVFNSPSEPESESDIDNACNFQTDSCYEVVSKAQYDELGLGVIPLHDISVEPFCTNHTAGGTYKLDEQTPTIEDIGASTQNDFNINWHLLNPLNNNICGLDPAVEDISLLDQIWRMKQFVLNTFMLDPEGKNISLQIQNWQLPP
ncbi:hypothetical protein LR48_Vigan07g132900 [Vigna angularis]|uniref:Uncharacterized protein n=1 Tax=Phaseolus angularis TaxID=3914 RepID=A0A0L9UXP6_PHAAN|nr:hypothetical protein LR48_Vigan07g132900 [Vigna angularis]